MAPYNYSLLDDEDVNALLDPQTLNSLRPTQQEMSPSQQPSAATLQLPELHKDPELEDAWRQLELQKIGEARAGSQYGLAEGLRDTVPTALALGLDAALNHGRGAVGVLQGGMNEVAAQQALRDKQRNAAGELAVKLHGRNALDPLAYERAMTARINAGTGQQKANQTQQHWVAAGDPNDPHTKGLIDIAGQRSGSSATGRLNAEHGLNAQTAGDKGAIRTAETDAELAARHEGAPIANADAADKARLEAEARVPSQIAEKQTPGAEEQRQRELLANARSPIPGTEIADENAWNAASSDATRRTAIEKAVAAMEQARSNVGTMVQLRQQYGSKLRWDTLTDQEKRIALDRMNTAQQMAVGGLGQLGSSGIVNAGEFPRYASTIPNGGLGFSDFTDEALGGLLGQSRDTQLEQLLGAQRQIEEASGVGLKPYGIRFGQGGGSPRAAPNVPPVVPGAVAPGAEDLPANLGDTGGPRDVPPITAKPSGGGSLRYLRKPDGTVVPTMKSDAEIQQLQALGFQLVNK